MMFQKKNISGEIKVCLRGLKMFDDCVIRHLIQPTENATCTKKWDIKFNFVVLRNQQQTENV
jgi:hypothetical protein